MRVTGNSETFNLKNIRTLKDLELPCQPVTTYISKLSHLKDMDLPETGGVVPEIHIGEDYTHAKIALKVVVGKKNESVATLTPFGWAIHRSKSQPGLRIVNSPLERRRTQSTTEELLDRGELWRRQASESSSVERKYEPKKF